MFPLAVETYSLHCGRRPHLVILQQIGVDKDAQRRRATKRRQATFGFGNLFSALTAEFIAERFKIGQRHVVLCPVGGFLRVNDVVE